MGMTELKLCAFADEAANDLDGQIDALTANGISLLEARMADGKNISDMTAEEARDLKRRLDARSLAVWSLGSPIGKVAISDDFDEHLDKFKRTLETAHIVGAKAIRIFSFYMENGEFPLYRDTVMERLGRFAELNRGSGITLCHENEKDIFGDMPERCLDIHRSVEGIRAVFDPANFIQCGADPLAAWKLLSPYTYYLHIKDADADGANVPAGTGLGRIPEIIAQYRDGGGSVLTLEPHLWSFSGLASLEKDGKAHVTNRADTRRDAFDLGVTSLKNILEELNN